MKKFIYIILFTVSTSLIITSCTEEEVSPKAGEVKGAGAGVQVDKI
jgi:hypothetical protein